ncbi:hypothetical protein SUGI_1509310 [Cryptomeria japonica]|uniref:Uncharacterized protein n=1 Tax=Cryptomeria japonica TaxID=3369 RepID=A0AAD3NVV1_CRYJA|nr:hypothetical protein SUGI_1509310 [Cryptomeria japonica]
MRQIENYLIPLKFGLLVLLASSIHGAQALPFPVPQSTLESDSRSLTYDLPHSNINQQQQHRVHVLDAPKYYKLNELLYKSRPRFSFMNDDDRSQADLRPLEVGAPQVGSRRRANGDEVDESSIDSLIRDMQPEKAVGRHEGDETGVTYEANSARRDAMGGRGVGGKAVMMDSSIGAYDEASIQKKSTNSIDEDSSGLGEDSARLRNQSRFQ